MIVDRAQHEGVAFPISVSGHSRPGQARDVRPCRLSPDRDRFFRCLEFRNVPSTEVSARSSLDLTATSLYYCCPDQVGRRMIDHLPDGLEVLKSYVQSSPAVLD